MRFLTCVLLILMTVAAKPYAPDGEGTIYVMGDFTGDFDVAYVAKLEPAPQNKSWTTLGIMLVGRVNPGPLVEVGLTYLTGNGPLYAFTSVHDAKGFNNYKSRVVTCSDGCLIELKGDASQIEAQVDGTNLGRWPRALFELSSPYVQLDGEVHGAGETISAQLIPKQTVAGGQTLPPASCGFANRGVTPSASPDPTFLGANNSETGQYIDLRTGEPRDFCFKYP